MRRGRRNDCHKMRRKFLQHTPLIEPRIRPAPHRYLAIAIALLRQPFRHVESIASFIHEWLELSSGISAPPHIHQRVHISMPGKVHRAIGIAVADIRGERENHRQRFLLSVRLVHCRVQVHSISHGNLHPPLHVNIVRTRRRRVLRPRVSRRDRKHPQHPAKHTAHNPPAKLIPLIHPVHLKATCFSAALSYRAIPPPCIFSDHFLLTCPLIPTLGLICRLCFCPCRGCLPRRFAYVAPCAA